MKHIGKVLALCAPLFAAACSPGFSQGAEGGLRLERMRMQWDSVLANAHLETGKTDVSSDDLRQSIRYEFTALQRSERNGRLERDVAKYLDEATFAVRISDRLDGNPSRAHSDYATPQAHDIQWLIGAPGNVIRFIYEDPRHEGRIRVKKLQATPAFLDSLTSIQRNYYFVMADPPWVSTVSLWTPQGANIIYVYGLQPLSLKDKEGNFVYPAPTGLRSLAQMAGTPFGNKAQSFLHRRQEPR